MWNHIKLSKSARVLLMAVLAGLPATAATGASQLVGFDAATLGAGNSPSSVGWLSEGTPMANNGAFLLQDETLDDPETTYGRYTSPPVGAGTMSRTSGQYGIEFRVRPLTDVPYFGLSHYANLAVMWSDDQFNFNVTIDLDTDDNGAGTTGGLEYGQNSLYSAATGIDWSTPHTVFVGYDSALEVFNFYVDDAYVSTVGYLSIARTPNFPFAQDAVAFGDHTTGQGIDVAAEWYSVAIYDVNSPDDIIPAIPGDINGDGFVGIADLNIVLGNWNAGTPPATGTPSIPEPATLSLLCLSGTAIVRRRWSR